MKTHKLAIVGGESLLGREIREVLGNRLRSAQVTLIGADDEASGLVVSAGEEAALVTPLDEEHLAEAEAVFLAGSASSSRKALNLLRGSATKPLIIDTTSLLEDQPSARLRAPLVEPPGFATESGAVQVVANPAAVALSLFYGRLHAAYPIKQSITHVFEPASQLGKRALDELHQQTVSLLSFKAVPKAVFDAQLSFNLLAGYGLEAPHKLEQSELLIERHLATLLSIGKPAPMPSLRLIQAPVFHGYSISVWVEFESFPGVTPLEEALASAQIDVRDAQQEPPSNVGMAGEGGIAVGAIARDRNNPRAAWFWIAADNLRLAADNAVEIVQQRVKEDA